MATAYKKKAEELQKQVDILREEMSIRSLLPTQLVEKLTRKREIATAQLGKFTDDMIAENKYINRLNAAMERQKVRDYTEVLELIVKLAQELPAVPGTDTEEP